MTRTIRLIAAIVCSFWATYEKTNAATTLLPIGEQCFTATVGISGMIGTLGAITAGTGGTGTIRLSGTKRISVATGTTINS